MNEPKLISVVKGYKATNKDMKCKGFQFELGKIHEHEGDLKICESGFHFCVHSSGVWSFYSGAGTRVFEIEAYDVLDAHDGYGSEVKMAARKIKLIREINITGSQNTGDQNTGDQNTGDQNTGSRNTGWQNTGDQNTGDWNATNYSTGFFCQKELKVRSFDVATKLTHGEFLSKHRLSYELGNELMKDDPIEFEKYKTIPGITEKKLASLHKKFIEGRKAK